jgi:hypothetical protein
VARRNTATLPRAREQTCIAMWYCSACISLAVASASLEGEEDAPISATGIARLDGTSMAEGTGACELLLWYE